MTQAQAVAAPVVHRHAEAAIRLRQAYDGLPAEPLRDILEPTDVAGAYAVQQINTRFWEAQGRRIVGRKVGLTAEAVRRQLGVDQPDYGVLFDDMRVRDGGVLSAALLAPRVEAEVAIVLGRDVDSPEATPDELFEAAAHAVAAIEIVDSRIADWRISFADTVADNGSASHFVLGSNPRPLAGLDLRTCGMALELNGVVASHGAGVACMGHPLVSAAWLARTMARAGQPLRSGEVVLTGALGPMVSIRPGDHVHAAIGGLGSVSFSLAESPA